jgi:serine/threonine protein kinase
VLDFGIAKPLASAPTEDEAKTRTLTRPPTRAGVLIGTPTYMSPEQVRGQGVDRRSDIWAFGVVLWEMLTGARLFEGDTDSDILLAVMQEEPDWHELPPNTAAPITRLLRRCLERDGIKRLHDIADARLEVEEAIAHERSGRGPQRKAGDICGLMMIARNGLLPGFLSDEISVFQYPS